MEGGEKWRGGGKWIGAFLLKSSMEPGTRPGVISTLIKDSHTELDHAALALLVEQKCRDVHVKRHGELDEMRIHSSPTHVYGIYCNLHSLQDELVSLHLLVTS